MAQPAGTVPLESTATAADALPSSTETQADCKWEGSVSNYLECQKESVSTTSIIAGGLGVTVGLFLLIGVCVWICNRRRARHPSSTNGQADAAEDAGEDVIHAPVTLANSEKSRYRAHQPPPPLGSRRTTRLNSASESETESYMRNTPPPPHPAHVATVQAQVQQAQQTFTAQMPSEIIGSPIHEVPRTLYPVNPSPDPRHLQHDSRQPAYSRRNSAATVRLGSVSEEPEPVPRRSKPERAGTQPLQVRKSLARPSMAIPSYYEATGTEPPVKPAPAFMPRPSSRVSLRPGIGVRSLTTDPAAPAVPLANRPLMEARRPSAPETRAVVRPVVERRATEGPKKLAKRGGLI